eukprot:Tbor_TRINITY_DN5650_c3_g2::TRINITY_DN5650_c3_g2_i11::g.9007::m.9007/K15711/SMARCA3, HLTF; SWI/SNF-related matrix-associated actin-dependent regulator of chromatin subfamily A3
MIRHSFSLRHFHSSLSLLAPKKSTTPTPTTVIAQGVSNSSDTKETTSFYSKFSYQKDEFIAIQPKDLVVDLFPFQKMGVGWMFHREQRYTGGIMADHLGMGKTVQMIGLCMAVARKDEEIMKSNERLAKLDNVKEHRVEGNRLLTVVRQMQRISSLQNCSKLTQPGMDLGALAEIIEKEVQKGESGDFTISKKEAMKWLTYAGKFHPAYRRKAEAFLKTQIESVFEEYGSPELRTLIVVPASLVLQWRSEILKKISPERNISVYVYHGAGKHISVTELETYDFVITTYQTLSNGISNLLVEDYDSTVFNREDSSPIMRAKWKRCILDEAHVIRNNKTCRWKAVQQINARKKWAVTATPLHNSIEDIQNLLEFVGCPTLPLLPDRNDAEAVLRDEALQSSIAECLQPVFLRRGPVMIVDNKRTVLVELPEKEELVKTATLSLEETNIYNDVLSRSRSALEGAMDRKVFHVFAMMTRLRQTCCHHSLNNGKAVQVYLCGICKSEATSAIITKCGHSFCYECIVARFQMEGDATESGGMAVRAPCPVCDFPINFSSLQTAKVISTSEHIAKIKSEEWKSSTKVDMILHEVDHMQKEFPDDKVVIFSHFTSFLNIISVALEMHNISFVRVDGSMPIVQRNQVVQTFQNSTNTRVMLASKTAVGVGLNLTMANHVLIVDPWWNPAIEEQAIHRCHRIGQKKKVYVKRFITEGTIEQYCFEICQRKKEFGDSILAAATGGEASASQKAHSKMMELVRRLDVVVVGNNNSNNSNAGEKKGEI